MFLEKFSFFSIDATFSETIARYVNNAPEKYANFKIEKIVGDGSPHLLLVEKKYIPEKMELRHSYGDIKNLRWRQQVCMDYFWSI